ncbi:hypothetical protein CASFOL_027884 [Castilleja foliolosa]|uniref:Uncharacterized protein n=1 Tax=Castilleja foliolosa TaxID=1961234 RepID=A0ABD3CG46_9LAMI
MSFLTFITGSTRSWQPALTVDTTTSSYWLNWRVLLCSIWILMSMIFASIFISKHECGRGPNQSLNPENQQQQESAGVLYEDEVWKPCLKSIHPAWLLGYRVFAFVVLLLMLILNVVVDGGGIFFFYTQWTFTLITVYFAFGSVLSIRGCVQYNHRHADQRLDSEAGSRKGMDINQDSLEREKAGFLAYAFQIIFQMNAGAVMLTDTVFWFILVPFLVIKAYNLNFLIINMHSINAVFLLGETALNSLGSLGLESAIFSFGLQLMYFSNGLYMRASRFGGHIHFLIYHLHMLHYVFNRGIDAHTVLRDFFTDNERKALFIVEMVSSVV